MGTQVDHGIRDTEHRPCHQDGDRPGTADTAWACSHGLQRPWSDGRFARRFQPGLPIRLESCPDAARGRVHCTISFCAAFSSFVRSLQYDNVSTDDRRPFNIRVTETCEVPTTVLIIHKLVSEFVVKTGLPTSF